jgi:zona occludens toxin (predicted ATPase)
MAFRALLFTTTTCQKCPAFKEFVSQKISFSVEILDETMDGFLQKAAEYSITSAPTIIIFDETQEIFRTSEQSDLDAFLKE